MPPLSVLRIGSEDHRHRGSEFPKEWDLETEASDRTVVLFIV